MRTVQSPLPPDFRGRQMADAATGGSDAGQLREVSGLPLVSNHGVPLVPPLERLRRSLAMKRLLDLELSVLALLMFAPVLAGIALAVKWSSRGPVLFQQARTGADGQAFTVLKFRTMHADAGDASGIEQTRIGDRRVTPLGRFLRRTSMDELPQLFNVIKGEMSLVGPRPHVAGMRAAGVPYEQLVPYYNLRLKVKPGVTGWAQVNGLRGPTTDAGVALARVDHDLAYIQNFSVWLDLRIIASTALREAFRGI
jgi:lipopolysaccharide/colanic/teichoic acid biosynthesis glycosyltransferase